MKILRKTLLFCSILLIINGCTVSGDKSSNILKKEIGGERIHDRFTIKPSRSYEECIELQPGMVFDYYYDASDFVDFNIHYHGEDKVHYPVTKKGSMGGKGTIDPNTHDFYIEEQEFYCLMWENVGEEPVKVSFACTLKQMHKERKMEKGGHMGK